MLKIGWELTPTYMNRLDLSTNLHMVEIEHVEMDQKTFTGDKVEDEETKVGVSTLYGEQVLHRVIAIVDDKGLFTNDGF